VSRNQLLEVLCKSLEDYLQSVGVRNVRVGGGWPLDERLERWEFYLHVPPDVRVATIKQHADGIADAMGVTGLKVLYYAGHTCVSFDAPSWMPPLPEKEPDPIPAGLRPIAPENSIRRMK